MESLKDFYKNKFNTIPADLEDGKGHFNVFDLKPYVGPCANSIPYTVRDFYKIMLVKGKGEVHYADRVNKLDGIALSFSNPQIPYAWVRTDEITGGVFCIFDKQFIEGFKSISDYEVFQPNGEHIFELREFQAQTVEQIFERMLNELESDYQHKNDVIRNLIQELIHFALKSDLGAVNTPKEHNASQRISSMFMELLERQFPIDDDHHQMLLRTPSDFATHLNVHVNHLNRTMKKTFGKTTTTLIMDRLLKEAMSLLRLSDWSIMDISIALGFKEPTHFTNFFKKRTGVNPTQYKNGDA
ncbi:helix-turn-helix domain-containing protein [Allomuricauda sp. NBRC 101325]|uniref:helix-turn-helix domain-containing protein n=1 Tax=Allomuricauda sp. NBRC 101325 TaxID=1113758 RepID=UPI00249FBE85|nr:helix-turn-helix domain-containing protein [Muricauda sp. NBRC 101325]GLU45142.1 AraC family transcriptional regulator [Muricauda sp. NBRC 101325]